MHTKVLIFSSHRSIRDGLHEFLLNSMHIETDDSIGLRDRDPENECVRGYGADERVVPFRIKDYGMVIIDPETLYDYSISAETIAGVFIRASITVVWLSEHVTAPRDVLTTRLFEVFKFLNHSKDILALQKKVPS